MRIVIAKCHSNDAITRPSKNSLLITINYPNNLLGHTESENFMSAIACLCDRTAV